MFWHGMQVNVGGFDRLPDDEQAERAATEAVVMNPPSVGVEQPVAVAV